MYNKQGFTLIELLIALFIIALMARIAVPNLTRLQPGYERDQFIAQLQELVSLGWQNAIITNKVHKVLFKIREHTASLEIATNKKNQEGEQIFEPLKEQYMDTHFTWPQHIQFKQFIIEGFDEMTRFAGRKTGEIWFFMVPQGLTQEVIINAIDTYDTINAKPQQIGLVLNPFSAQFKVYDAFQK